MSLKVTEDLVASIARLSRLALSADDLAEMHGHFEKVLRFVESLDSLDTSSIDPSVFALETFNVMAADENRPSLPVERSLMNAPKQQDGFFLVPRIIQESS